jgi:hypothetical protein
VGRIGDIHWFIIFLIDKEMKIPQPKGTKGSLNWLQDLINKKPAIFKAKIIKELNIPPKSTTWLSPLKSDQYAEYRDGDFLKVIGLGRFKSRLREFWPNRGPQWDALGRSSEMALISWSRLRQRFLKLCRAWGRSLKNPFPCGLVKKVAMMLKAIHASEDRQAAQDKAEAVIAKLKTMKLRQAAKKVQDSIDETLTYSDFPDARWQRI